VLGTGVTAFTVVLRWKSKTSLRNTCYQRKTVARRGVPVVEKVLPGERQHAAGTAAPPDRAG